MLWSNNVLKVGQRLEAPTGNVYRVVRFIARGGFGEVYEATHEQSGKSFAIKCLQLHKTDRKTIERTRREGIILAQLRHPNIVRVFEIEIRPDGLIWMVMELLVGRTLRNLIDQTKPRVPLPWALRIGVDLASALSALHAVAIHRDLKPENVHISLDGKRVCLLDLGAGKVIKAWLVTTDPRLSMGTLPYMSPEQLLEPRRIDARSDLWALGVMLYEMVAGRHPFATPESAVTGWGAVSEGIMHSPFPEFSLAAAHVPEYVGEIIARLLEKDRDRRYASAIEVQTALEAAARRFADEHPTALPLSEVAHTLMPEVSQVEDLSFLSSAESPYDATPDPLRAYAATEAQQTQPGAAHGDVAYATTDKTTTPPVSCVAAEPPAVLPQKTAPILAPAVIAQSSTVDARPSRPNRLVVVLGPNPGSSYVLDGPRVTIGRSSDAAITIDHEQVSRTHAEITRTSDGGFEIVDLGSVNGIRVNGFERSRAIIKAGDLIELGDVRLRFVGEGKELRDALPSPPALKAEPIEPGLLFGDERDAPAQARARALLSLAVEHPSAALAAGLEALHDEHPGVRVGALGLLLTGPVELITVFDRAVSNEENAIAISLALAYRAVFCQGHPPDAIVDARARARRGAEERSAPFSANESSELMPVQASEPHATPEQPDSPAERAPPVRRISWTVVAVVAAAVFLIALNVVFFLEPNFLRWW